MLNPITLVIFVLLLVLIFLLFFFLFTHTKKTKEKIKTLENTLEEKSKIQQDHHHIQTLENDFNAKVDQARETLNREIFELQKDLFEKISKKP